MKLTYKHTTIACYMSYIAGAIINNFTPLLFIVFNTDYGISLDKLSVLIVLNFGVQLVVDLLGAKYIDKIGYRKCLIIALFMAALGLVFLGVLPEILPHFSGLVISVITYAIGSGILEVMVSPAIEALPRDNKSSPMSLLHSFYCWGSVLVVAVSTLYFKYVGLDAWRELCFLWAIVPAVTILLFLKVPIVPFGEGREKGTFKKLFRNKLFWVFAILMLSSGASELAIAQWASLFAQKGLGVSKAMGDLLGPCLFAILMGIGRVLYGIYAEKINTANALIISSLICIIGYLMSSLCQNPIISLIGCGLCGFGSAMMWPGTLSLAAKHCAYGGTAIFGLLAMSGDIGCSVGPFVVARVASKYQIFGSDLKAGILSSVVFPIMMIAGVVMLGMMLRNKETNTEE